MSFQICITFEFRSTVDVPKDTLVLKSSAMVERTRDLESEDPFHHFPSCFLICEMKITDLHRIVPCSYNSLSCPLPSYGCHCILSHLAYRLLTSLCTLFLHILNNFLKKKMRMLHCTLYSFLQLNYQEFSSKQQLCNGNILILRDLSCFGKMPHCTNIVVFIPSPLMNPYTFQDPHWLLFLCAVPSSLPYSKSNLKKI